LFRRTRMSESEQRRILCSVVDPADAGPQFMTLGDPIETPPPGFVCDRSRTEIGQGPRAFAIAREAFLRWRQFDLVWVSVVDPSAAIAPGQIVGVEAHTAGLWSLNVCRVQETVDTPSRFGFSYSTTAVHVEEGQERFLIDLDSDDQIVSYSIDAISRPRHPLVWLAYPFARAMQRRFVRDSFRRMGDIVHDYA
jgi:uncharacterized protein (UPF0548 family)